MAVRTIWCQTGQTGQTQPDEPDQLTFPDATMGRTPESIKASGDQMTI